ncbi:MAG: class I SAM-dependent methyltransferase [Candidatus Omnitrophica bacterium]|nr:class I SAM-dependent methyltransferase [Candidatus Omnitrophota bacterium]
MMPFWYNKLKRFETYRDQVILRLISEETVGRILDIGCGNGDFLINNASRFKEAWGVEISNKRVINARRRIKKKKLKNIFFKVLDVDNGLPFKKSYFDIVTIIASFGLFYDIFFVLEEIKRILKRGGILIIEESNLAFLPRRLALFFGLQPWTSTAVKGWDGGRLHYFTKKSLIDLLKKYGFKIEKVTGSGIFANLRNWWPSLLSGDLIIKARKP